MKKIIWRLGHSALLVSLCCICAQAYATDTGTGTGTNNLIAAGEDAEHPGPYTSEGVPNALLPRAPGKESTLASIGDVLDAHGINYQGMLFGAAFGDISTGQEPGHVGGQVMFINDVDVDLDKLVSLHGAKIHAEVSIYPFTYPAGQPTKVNFGTWASSYLGGDQYPPHAADAPWLSLLTYEQLFLDDKLDVEVGKTNMLRYFFGPNCGLDFTCTDSLVKFVSGLEDASLSSMGAHIKYNLTPKFWIETGVQQVRDYNSYSSRNGWNLSTDMGEGAWMTGGAGYHTDFSQSAYPSDYRLDYYYNNTRLTDSYTHASHWGSDGVIFKMQQTIWSESGATASNPMDAPRSLGVFGSIEHTFDQTRPIGWGGTFGLLMSKPFPTIGGPWFSVNQLTFLTMYDRISKDELLYERATRESLGGTDQLTSPNEFRFELNAVLGIGRNLILQPTLEYILNPDSSQSSSPNMPRSGWLAGITAIMTFGNPHRP
jgi:porin